MQMEQQATEIISYALVVYTCALATAQLQGQVWPCSCNHAGQAHASSHGIMRTAVGTAVYLHAPLSCACMLLATSIAVQGSILGRDQDS